MFRAATVVTMFLIGLGVFHHPCQSDHELLGHPLNSTRIITLGLHHHLHPLPPNVPSGWQASLKVAGYP